MELSNERQNFSLKYLIWADAEKCELFGPERVAASRGAWSGYKLNTHCDDYCSSTIWMLNRDLGRIYSKICHSVALFVIAWNLGGLL